MWRLLRKTDIVCSFYGANVPQPSVPLCLTDDSYVRLYNIVPNRRILHTKNRLSHQATSRSYLRNGTVEETCTFVSVRTDSDLATLWRQAPRHSINSRLCRALYQDVGRPNIQKAKDYWRALPVQRTTICEFACLHYTHLPGQRVSFCIVNQRHIF